MSAKDRPRFDIDAVRDLAGEKVFARGKEYFSDGQVQIIALEPERVLAQVDGTEIYRTEVTGRGKSIGGECSCRAFEDWGFCKHMVATALAANAAGTGSEAKGAGVLSRIRDHLRGKGVDALIEMIVKLAERDLTLLGKLDTAAALSDGDDSTTEARLRKAIDAATRVSDFVDYGETADWAAEVDAALDMVADLASGERAGIALKLAERSIDRIERAAESIDDSDGHCGALLHRARDIHLAAARIARPDPLRLARDLFAREIEGRHETFDRAAALYADVLGNQGLAEYRRLAGAALDKLPARSRQNRGRHEFTGGYDRLRDVLDFFAEREGDLEARIALRAKDLSSPRNYLRLAEFCLSHGRAEEALRRAEEGLWVFEDDPPDEPLVLFTVDLLSKVGRKKDAQARLWQVFKEAPSFASYDRLRKLGGVAARGRVVEFLEAKLRERRPGLLAAEFLIRILVHEKMFDAAWAIAREHEVSLGWRDTLAQASEATHPREALEVYAERVDWLANTGGNPAYEQAAKLIARMATLRSAAEQAAYVAALKSRFRRKYTFMRLLV
jgi:uncharacterized Zn finger protein